MTLTYKALRDRRRRINTHGLISTSELFASVKMHPPWPESKLFLEDLEGIAYWIRESPRNASQVYGSLCNVLWSKGDIEFHVSFRTAGRITSIIFHNDPNADYLDFYPWNTSSEIPLVMQEHMKSLGWSFIHIG